MSSATTFDIEVVELDGETVITLRPELDFGVTSFSPAADGVYLVGDRGQLRHFDLDPESAALLSRLEEVLVMEFPHGALTPAREVICSRET